MNDETYSREYELKLVGAAADMRELERRIRKRFGRSIMWKEENLTTAYFDTRDRRLQTRGVSLRVRRNGRDNKQTVKAAAGDGVAALARNEWETAVSTFRPALDGLPADARERLGLVLPNELRRIFTIEVKRRKVDLRVGDPGVGDGVAVDLVFDNGQVKAGRKSEALRECEFELLAGRPGMLLDLVGDLAQGTGLRIGRETKAGRGYRLLDGAAEPVPVHAPKFEPSPQDTVSRTLANVFTRCMANVLDNEIPASLGHDPEGVHQMRVSIRRMRSALSVFGKLLDPERVAWLKSDLKWLGASLGPARDWDVFITEMLAGVSGYGIDEEALAIMAEEAENQRQAGYEIARTAISSDRFTDLVLRLSAFVENEGWLSHEHGMNDPLHRPVIEVAPKLLNRPHKKLLAAGADLADMALEDRHAVRILLKKVRYSVDFLSGLYPEERVGPFLRSVKKLQDDFGHLNDVAVASDLVEKLVSAKGRKVSERRKLERAAGLVVAWYARGVREEESAFLADWDSLARTRPFWKGNR